MGRKVSPLPSPSPSPHSSLPYLHANAACEGCAKRSGAVCIPPPLVAPTGAPTCAPLRAPRLPHVPGGGMHSPLPYRGVCSTLPPCENGECGMVYERYVPPLYSLALAHLNRTLAWGSPLSPTPVYAQKGPCSWGAAVGATTPFPFCPAHACEQSTQTGFVPTPTPFARGGRRTGRHVGDVARVRARAIATRPPPATAPSPPVCLHARQAHNRGEGRGRRQDGAARQRGTCGPSPCLGSCAH